MKSEPPGWWQRYPPANDERDELLSIGVDSARRVDAAIQQLAQVVQQTRRKMWIGGVVSVCVTLGLVSFILLGRFPIAPPDMEEEVTDAAEQPAQQVATALAEVNALRERTRALELAVRPSTPPAAEARPDQSQSLSWVATATPLPLNTAAISRVAAGSAQPEVKHTDPSTSISTTAEVIARLRATLRGAGEETSHLARAPSPKARSPQRDASIGEDRASTQQAPGGSRVVIHYRDGVSSQSEANRIAALATPLAVRVQTRLVEGTPSKAEIRFFYSADETQARRLAESLRSLTPGLDVRNFSSYRPSPSQGTIEVWVPSRT